MNGLGAAALGMLSAAIADVLASRAGVSRVAAYAISLAIGLATALLAAFVVSGDISSLWVAIISYAAWWFIALNVIQALQSSLRIQILREVRQSGGRIRMEHLPARYNDESLLALRLRRLVDSGAVAQRDGRLYVASSGLRCLTALFMALKKLYTGHASEFGSTG